MYYKVVHQFLDGQNASITLWSDPKIRVLYRVGEWTKPNNDCGPLCVFRDLEDARDFWQSDPQRKVFECEIKESPAKEIWVDDVWPWHNKRFIIEARRLPPGTVLASEVKLIQEVQVEWKERPNEQRLLQSCPQISAWT